MSVEKSVFYVEDVQSRGAPNTVLHTRVAHYKSVALQARKLIQEDELEALADGDELVQARRAGYFFSDWHEAPLHCKFRHVFQGHCCERMECGHEREPQCQDRRRLLACSRVFISIDSAYHLQVYKLPMHSRQCVLHDATESEIVLITFPAIHESKLMMGYAGPEVTSISDPSSASHPPWHRQLSM